MLGERIASQSEVIRAILSGYSPCCGSRTGGEPGGSAKGPWEEHVVTPGLSWGKKYGRSGDHDSGQSMNGIPCQGCRSRPFGGNTEKRAGQVGQRQRETGSVTWAGRREKGTRSAHDSRCSLLHSTDDTAFRRRA